MEMLSLAPDPGKNFVNHTQFWPIVSRYKTSHLRQKYNQGSLPQNG